MMRQSQPLDAHAHALEHLHIQKIAIIMSGGGAKGAYEAGVLKPLLRFIRRHFPGVGIRLVGVSAGAINAVGLAALGIDDLHYFWKTTTEDDVTKRYPVWRWPDRILLKKERSIYDNMPLKRLLAKTVSKEDVLDSGYEVMVGTASLGAGEFVLTSAHEPDFLTQVVASTAIPGVWPPEVSTRALDEAGDHTYTDDYVDGGAIHVTPMKGALGCDFAFVVTTMPTDYLGRSRSHYHRRDFFGIIKRSIDLVMEFAFRTDINHFRDINQLLARLLEAGVPAADLPFQYIPNVMLMPARHLGSGMNFDPDQMEAWLLQGQADAAMRLNWLEQETFYADLLAQVKARAAGQI